MRIEIELWIGAASSGATAPKRPSRRKSSTTIAPWPAQQRVARAGWRSRAARLVPLLSGGQPELARSVIVAAVLVAAPDLAAIDAELVDRRARPPAGGAGRAPFPRAPTWPRSRTAERRRASAWSSRSRSLRSLASSEVDGEPARSRRARSGWWRCRRGSRGRRPGGRRARSAAGPAPRRARRPPAAAPPGRRSAGGRGRSATASSWPSARERSSPNCCSAASFQKTIGRSRRRSRSPPGLPSRSVTAAAPSRSPASGASAGWPSSARRRNPSPLRARCWSDAIRLVLHGRDGRPDGHPSAIDRWPLFP